MGFGNERRRGWEEVEREMREERSQNHVLVVAVVEAWQLRTNGFNVFSLYF